MQTCKLSVRRQSYSGGSTRSTRPFGHPGCIRSGRWLLAGSALLFLTVLSAQPTVAAGAANPYVLRTFEYNGKLVDEILVPGSPPPPVLQPAVVVPEPQVQAGINNLLEVPAFTWCYGCSATSAAMLMGFYDRHGYGNMYAGPVNGAVCPLNNEIFWGHTYYPGATCGECPLSASHLGWDGRNTRGHVDDYWVDYGYTGSDLYQYGGWAEHAADCTADFMGTSQAKFSNTDGSTTFYNYTDGTVLCDYTGNEPSRRDGCHGMRLFAESRGFTVLANCSQYIYGYNGNTKGFTFAQFKAEIDAGRPVLIQLAGHTMLGYGYNDSGSTLYVHDTWDNNDHSMTWGGSYGGMQHYGVTYFQLSPSLPPGISSQPADLTVREGRSATFTVGATGPSLRYYWQRNGTLISGVSASAYTLNNVQLSDSASQFSCLVSNIYSTTNSRAATLTVLPLRPVLGAVRVTNGIFAFAWSAMLGETFQVQYKTDLPPATWNNLGGTFSATNTTLRVSEALNGTRRFYRVVLMP